MVLYIACHIKVYILHAILFSLRQNYYFFPKASQQDVSYSYSLHIKSYSLYIEGNHIAILKKEILSCFKPKKQEMCKNSWPVYLYTTL